MPPPGHDRDASELRLGLAGCGAREGDNLLSADLGCSLGLSAHAYQACHSDGKYERKNTVTNKRLHLDPSLKMQFGFPERLSGRRFPAHVSVFRKRPHSTTSRASENRMKWIGQCRGRGRKNLEAINFCMLPAMTKRGHLAYQW